MEVSMSNKRYTEEFRAEAVKQVTDRGHSVAEVAGRLGISIHSLYAWRKAQVKPGAVRLADTEQAAELRRVKSELRRVTEERDILKKAAVSSTGRCNMILGCMDTDERMLWQGWDDLGYHRLRSVSCGNDGRLDIH